MGTTRPIRLLVVCSANTCRSPMAAALLTAEFATSGVAALVASAGTEGPSGRPASAASIEVMGEVGLDISGHRSPGDGRGGFRSRRSDPGDDQSP